MSDITTSELMRRDKPGRAVTSRAGALRSSESIVSFSRVILALPSYL